MRTQQRLAGLLIFLTLLPFAVLCCYSHPGADDFTDAVQRAGFGFSGMQRDLYLNLTGRLITSVLLTEASPLALHELPWHGLAPAGALLAARPSTRWLCRCWPLATRPAPTSLAWPCRCSCWGPWPPRPACC